MARWWGDNDAGDVRRDLVEPTDGVALAIEAGGELVGAITYEEETSPEYRHAGIDLFLTAAAQGRGLGPRRSGSSSAISSTSSATIGSRSIRRPQTSTRSAPTRGRLPPGRRHAAVQRAPTARGATACSWTCSLPSSREEALVRGSNRLRAARATGSGRSARSPPPLRAGRARRSPGRYGAAADRDRRGRRAPAPSRPGGRAGRSQLVVPRDRLGRPPSTAGRARDRVGGALAGSAS